MYAHLREAADFILAASGLKPRTGIVARVGVEALAQSMEVLFRINFDRIPHCPKSLYASKGGSLLIGRMQKQIVVTAEADYHSCDEVSMQDMVFPVRVMKLLGVGQLFLTDACTGINPTYAKGELVIADDHINLMGGNPLVGKNIAELGPRFPDMSAPYDPALAAMIREIASDMNCQCHTGVYVAVNRAVPLTDPDYRFLRSMGGDCVGLGIVPEVIAARHMALPVCAISVLAEARSANPENQPESPRMDRMNEVKAPELLSELLRRSQRNE